MKREYTPASKWPLITYRVLVVLLLAIILLIITCTIYALVRPSGSEPILHIGSNNWESPIVLSSHANGTAAMFSDISGLRIPIGNPPVAAVIVSISFPYPPDDILFTQEIESRVEEFRSVAVSYFSSLSLRQLTNFDENTAKAEILRQYNALLRLGTIENLYFHDLMVIE